MLITLLTVAMIAPGAAMAQTVAQAPGGQREDGGLLRRLDAARVVQNPETDTVSLVGADGGDPIERPAGLSPDASPAAAARAQLQTVGPAFGIEDPASGAELQDTEAVGRGRTVARFQQVYKDVPVLGGEVQVQTTGSNELLSAAGEALPEISVDTEPGVGAGQAREAALAAIAKQYETEPGGLDATEPELWIFDPALLGGPGPREPRLVWRTEVTPKGLDEFRELVLVDAQMGNVALNFDQIHTAKNRETYTANNASALPGTLVCDESNPSCAGNTDGDAQLAHRYAGDTYDFYLSNHARDSIDGAGMTLSSTVDYCPTQIAADCPYANAFWNGTRMVYGDGYSAADDVVGHELTHGVTDSESRLFYYYQSGAINESLSDVWGEFVDLTNTTGTDTEATRWLIGEDLPGTGAIRDMQNPGAFGDPSRMRSPNYFADASEQDAGGVHINSGVNNKAAYLMADGGTFNGKTVAALGIQKTARIYYEAQTNLLTSASDYRDLHAALQQACENLTGTNSGITGADCAEVEDAVDATEMNLTPTTAPNPEAPVCPTGQSPSDLFSDDLENTASGNWTAQTITGTNEWYYPQNPNPLFDATYATSGTTNMWGYDQPTTADYAIARTADVTPPAGKGTYLRFNHAYGFEDDAGGAYDGGRLEYSTDNGATWINAGPLITNNGYSGTISTQFDNPLGGRKAFVGESNGYISSRADLSSFAGQSVRFRFRIGTDSAFGDYGWFIDDVRVYTCETPTGSDTTPPTVASVKPASRQTDVSRLTNIAVTFSEAMNAGSLNADTVKLVRSGGTAPIPLTMTTSSDANGRMVLKLDPFGPTTQKLAKGATYKLTVEGAGDGGASAVRDAANNEMARDETSSFKIKRR